MPHLYQYLKSSHFQIELWEPWFSCCLVFLGSCPLDLCRSWLCCLCYGMLTLLWTVVFGILLVHQGWNLWGEWELLGYAAASVASRHEISCLQVSTWLRTRKLFSLGTNKDCSLGKRMCFRFLRMVAIFIDFTLSRGCRLYLLPVRNCTRCWFQLSYLMGNIWALSHCLGCLRARNMLAQVVIGLCFQELKFGPLPWSPCMWVISRQYIAARILPHLRDFCTLITLNSGSCGLRLVAHWLFLISLITFPICR